MRISFANSPFTLLSHAPPLPFTLYPPPASTPPPYHLYLGTTSEYKFLMLLSPKIPHRNKIKNRDSNLLGKDFLLDSK